MARPIWKGNITFGLVNVPVTLLSAEKRNELHFRLLDSRNKARVHYERVNEETGEEVPWSEVVKAFEYDKGNYVLLDEEDFKRAAPEATQSVEIQDFVDEDDLDYVYFETPYYLVPGKKGEKGYVLLREILRRTGKVGICKVVIRTRQYLAALIPQGDALVLDLLRFEQEIRKEDEFDFPKGDLKEYKISEREMEMAEKLVESMTAEWAPAKYHDEYQEALMRYVDEKVRAGGEVRPEPAHEEKRTGAEVINLMDVLKKSLEQTKKKEKGKGQGAKRPAQAAKSKTPQPKRKEHREERVEHSA